ncbi:MFS transporter, partial [Mycobacterium tuberculosis]|nr:MFS transporter [Mycobacterium tuberculosis]
LGGYLGPFGIGALKEHTGQLSSGLYFLALVVLFGVLLTGVVSNRLERRQRLASTRAAEGAR